MNLGWTEPARDRLVEVEAYIAQDVPERGVNFVLELLEQTEKLAKFPDSGRIGPEDERQTARELIHEGYRIIYRIEGTTMYILSVFEGLRLLRLADLK